MPRTAPTLWLAEHGALLRTGGAVTPAAWPAPWSQATDDQLAEAVAGLLDAAGVKAKSLDLALPAAWVLVSAVDVPTEDPTAVAGAVRVRVTRDYPTAGGPDAATAIDYAIDAADGKSRVTLAAVQRETLRRVDAVLAHPRVGRRAASIGVAAAAAASNSPDTPAVLVTPFAVELLHPRAGRLASLAALDDPDDPQRVAAQVAMQLASRPDAGRQATRVLFLGDAEPAARQVADALHTTAAALPAATPAPGADAIDFTRLRFETPQRVGMPTWKRRAILAAAMLALTALVGAWLWWGRAAEVRALEEELAILQPDAAVVEADRALIRAARPWFDKRSPILPCIAALTDNQPESGSLQVVEFRFDDGDAGAVRCRADRPDTMKTFVAGLEATDQLADVRLRDWSQLRGQAGESRDAGGVQFEVTFRYTETGG